jgi:hypothetical protein
LWPLKVFVEDKVSKRISALSIAVLVLAGSFVGISSASAAVAYKACSPANSKTMIAKLSYTCTTNPAGTSTKLVWVSKPCIIANKSFLSAKSLSAAVGSSFEGRISSATRLKATSTRLIAAAQKNVDTWSKNLAAYLVKNPNVMTSGTESDKKMVTTVQDGITRNKQRVIDQNANIVKLDAQIKDATDGAAKTVNDLAAAQGSIATACK